MREIELKFSVHPSFVIPSLENAPAVGRVEPLPEQDLRATYYDTSDLRLARAGVTLRYRTGDDNGPRWTVKLPVTSDSQEAVRDEHDFEAPRDVPPEAAIDLVTAYARTAEIEPAATLATKRRRWRVLGGDRESVELFDDEVSLIDGDRIVARFREIEVEQNGDAGPGYARQIGKLLRNAGAGRAEPIPKVVRALGPRATAPSDLPPESSVGPRDPAGEALTQGLRRSLHRLVANDPAARLGDVEGVHQMRVAARRMRSDLRTFRRLLDAAKVDHVRTELKWLGSSLGGVRDSDVLRDRLARMTSDVTGDLAPLFEELKRADAEARSQLREDLRSERYRTLLDELVALAADPPLTDKATRRSKKALPPIVSKPWRRLEREVESANQEDDAQLHAIRIRAKRARYAAEAAAPALEKKTRAKAEGFASRVAKVQDALGLHQDAVVARQRVLEVADGVDGDRSFDRAVGRLIDRLDRLALEARADWRETWDAVEKTEKEWLRS